MDNPMKKRKTMQSCFLCEKNAFDCDGVRPCSKCIANGHPQMCYGIGNTEPVQPISLEPPNPLPSIEQSQDQFSVNQYLIQEISTVKESEEALTEQLHQIQHRNFLLKEKLKKLSESTALASYQQHPPSYPYPDM